MIVVSYMIHRICLPEHLHTELCVLIRHHAELGNLRIPRIDTHVKPVNLLEHLLTVFIHRLQLLEQLIAKLLKCGACPLHDLILLMNPAKCIDKLTMRNFLTRLNLGRDVISLVIGFLQLLLDLCLLDLLSVAESIQLILLVLDHPVQQGDLVPQLLHLLILTQRNNSIVSKQSRHPVDVHHNILFPLVCVKRKLSRHVFGVIRSGCPFGLSDWFDRNTCLSISI